VVGSSRLRAAIRTPRRLGGPLDSTVGRQMKLVTLNIQHGGGRRIPGILDYLRSQEADAIVLTEFRENSNAEALRSGLAENGFHHFAGASVVQKEKASSGDSRE